MNCPVCNRPLKSKKSLSKGIGPICEIKVKKLENSPPEGQITIDELLDKQSVKDEIYAKDVAQAISQKETINT
ncbi:DUF6011 domain-containing protein [Cytobacillus solani]|uniref:DUF6011 domain-containing protein n=1 Tax=Cytobacillus solani TaxID=1637975 RepID=UPI00207A754E|nr:DUF6011 domain-containing protein [Cytobacillus solani]USK54218.1 DUF6011 domain-containing protein [Cytobacillus solani]